MTRKAIIEVEGLAKSFGPHRVLTSVNLTVQQGDVTFLIGPSGNGKSTLLRCLNFLTPPDAGRIVFDGDTLCTDGDHRFWTAPERALRRARSEMPMVFQHFNLFAHRTVLQNVIEAPIHVQKRPKKEATDQALETLAQVGLADKRDHYPDQLSGGQKQRVAIARALAMNPKLILFDEPTSALDPELVTDVLETIRSLAERGMTLIIVSHEMSFARRLASRIHFICDGTILESGTPEQIFEAPTSERLASFIRSIRA
ncbi:amino acid ABC transporter ATP-binding protein [Rhizobium sp. CC-YZS058]|uniref:amino acid ABC transporter ATP-binding protein n=1 Tax=Rhizobium sp. CC-YZS058 TaxID=3042153 RepID=UPI002B05A6CB|nr:amino acid ABC transporter ATP-binding protein [Rhizobium sp. CC-YZS058]MEA3536518.1 amino acid ABC transporter ATP-binding protein [Rhizobium sp. CC-YZS058]